MFELNEIVERSVCIVNDTFFNHKFYMNNIEIPQIEVSPLLAKIKSVYIKLYHTNVFDNFEFDNLKFEIKEFKDHNNWKAYQSYEGNILQNNYILCKDGFISFNCGNSGC